MLYELRRDLYRLQSENKRLTLENELMHKNQADHLPGGGPTFSAEDIKKSGRLEQEVFELKARLLQA